MGRLLRLDYHYWRGTTTTSVPYEACVPHPIGGWAPVPSPETRERVRDAQRRLAELHNAVSPTPSLRWCLSRAEGISSSSVEGIVTTLRSLTLLESLRGRRRHETDARDRQALGSVLMNSRALDLGDSTDTQVEVSDIERLHRSLFADTDQQFDAGRLRDEQVWIGSGQRTPERAHFVPPPHTEVPSLMRDLAMYISDSSVWASPVAKAAVAHTQFETIHPFTDGNGRIGRALMHLVLRREGRLPTTVPISAAIDAHKDEYYRSLRPYSTFVGDADDEGRAEAMHASTEYMADAVIVACDYAEAASRSIDDWEQRCAAASLRSRSAAREIMDAMSEAPAATLPFLSEKTGRPRRSVARGLSQLVDARLIAEGRDVESGVRTFEIPEVLSIVDNRNELLEESWGLNLAGAHDITEQLHELAAAKAAQHTTGATPQPRCGHVGVRNGKNCVRRAGHPGDHAY